jgi:hypothetical protein
MLAHRTKLQSTWLLLNIGLMQWFRCLCKTVSKDCEGRTSQQDRNREQSSSLTSGNRCEDVHHSELLFPSFFLAAEAIELSEFRDVLSKYAWRW